MTTSKYKTTQARTTGSDVIKPGELIDVVEEKPLLLSDRRCFNFLLSEAWEHITEDVEHKIPKSLLLRGHKNHARLDASIGLSLIHI